MRVIAGKARSLRLKTIEGLSTRPTTDRIKETLFNMISLDLADCCFLDLFAGSGGIGIEALSRGAKEAVFVEQNKKAADCIRENLKFTGLSGGSVLQKDVLRALQELNGRKRFDFIFMDPPYNKDWEKKVLTELCKMDILAENAVLIVEASLDTDFSYVQKLGYEILRQKQYKTNQHVFLIRSADL
ncbi:MAG TPA: 16S rRNA (guanine(966)-N(2))-methyltransferase RsmD [Lachnospiraceae bacterium]|nr:16S rRNA (guanine(966)-N(2))-methyltransferase RsmD [Lachnospiraceae bacterium]